jgi:phosphatidylethanolamine-binding protein (PEBP) family uncharacterized protein
MCAMQQCSVSSESKTGGTPVPRGTGILPVFRIAAVVAVPLLIPLAVAAVAPKLAPFAAAFPGERTFERPAGAVPPAASAFAPFRERLGVSWDADYFYIEGNGLPDHNMMVGITAWQQQVPLPQPYVGDNAWRVPLMPVPAAEPAMIEGRFLRGAIAIAVNGIPIFNPQNNRGEVSYEIGELDQWGGHCGRADDYHYHIAPVHLESVVGKGKPVAYALDGYPVLGLTEADGSAPKNLDECHGHDHDGLGYHYHASEKYPYVLGGFHGEVVEAEGQVDPQPRAQGVREALQALRGAKITGFEQTGEGAYQLSYTVDGDARTVRYRIGEDGTFPFEFDNGREGKTSEVYRVRGGGGGGGGGDRPPRGGGGGPEMRPPGGGGGGQRPDPLLLALDSNEDGYIDAEELEDAEKRLKTLDRNGDGQLDREEATGRPPGGGNRGGGGEMERGPGRIPAPGAASPATPSGGAGELVSGFVLSSPEIGDDGRLPVEFTGDGAGVSPPLVWEGAPAGTKSFALIMDHLAPGNEMKSYWVMWDIPATMTSLPQEATEVGQVGTGFRGEAGYEPPHSQGPGDKTYVLHLYALSATPEPAGPAERVSREALLEAMEGKILGRADLSVIYARP